MTEPALRLVSDLGEVVEQADVKEWRERYDRAAELLADKDATIERMGKDLRRMRDRVRELEGEFADKAARDPRAQDIRDVLLYWRDRCASHRTRIVPDSPRWRKVRDRLTEQDIDGHVLAPKDLCEAVDGALLSDFHTGKDPKTGGKSYLGAETLFRDADTVQHHQDRLRAARGEAPLAFAALPFPDEVVFWLSDECSCGHSRAHHVGAEQGCWAAVGDKACGCDRFDGLQDRIDRFLERNAVGRDEVE